MGIPANLSGALETRDLRVLVLPETDSTNSEARRRAETGDSGRLWIRADRQTQGRGRRGRAWISPPGNLLASFLMRPACDAGMAAQLSYVAALSVADLIRRHVPDGKIGLKWPNDVLVGGRKIAGILLESGSARQGVPEWLAVGIGVNLTHHPEDIERPATDLRKEADKSQILPDPDDALAALALAFDDWMRLWDEGRGFAKIRAAWLEKAHGLGERLIARLDGREITGRFDGLDETGGLVLALADGSRRTVLGGEVFFAGNGHASGD